MNKLSFGLPFAIGLAVVAWVGIGFPAGGWLPLVLGVVVFTLMSTWRRGRDLVLRELKQSGLALEPFIASLAEHPPLRVPGTAVFLTVFIWIGGQRKWYVPLVGIGGALVATVVFVGVVYVALPTGVGVFDAVTVAIYGLLGIQ